MFFLGNQEYTIEELRYIFLAGNFSKLVHKELNINLAAKEKELVLEETKELVTLNMQFGGSELGYLYNGELFAVAPTFKKSGVQPIHSEFEQQALMLKENRMDIPQYMIFFAHFLAVLQRDSEKDPTIYAANVPTGLSKFSHSLRRLESFVDQLDGERKKEEVFKRDDPSKTIFFMHFDRINGPLNRFLFRRITN